MCGNLGDRSRPGKGRVEAALPGSHEIEGQPFMAEQREGLTAAEGSEQQGAGGVCSAVLMR